MRYYLILFLLIFSCSSKKDVLLIQDSRDSDQYILNFKDITIQPDDILRIKISSKSPEISALFEFPQNINGTNTLDGFKINGYLVNSEGFIKIPSLKPILIKDMTITQASNLIENKLRLEQDIINTTVDVKIVNSYFTVLGEVNKPGRYNFLQNNMDVFQALGIAGDLTINGKRNDIKILKTIDGKMKVNSIDLTTANLILSENFQIFPGDIIIVNANNARVKNAGLIGNFGNLLSVLTFLLSSIILISNN